MTPKGKKTVLAVWCAGQRIAAGPSDQRKLTALQKLVNVLANEYHSRIFGEGIIDMVHLIAVFLAVFLGASALHAHPAETGYDPELFHDGSVLPVDTIVIQVAEDGQIGVLQAALVVGDGGSGTYRLIELISGEMVAELPVAFDERGVVSVVSDAAAGISDELAAVVFQAGCGRWWKGRRNYWRVCTGRESCGGDGSHDKGRRWCTKLVSRDQCKSQGNCPTNNSQANNVLFRSNFPIGILPPVDEQRYCCKLKCTSTNPNSCKMDCEEVDVGPCEVFTVNCPGTLGEGGCKWE